MQWHYKSGKFAKMKFADYKNRAVHTNTTRTIPNRFFYCFLLHFKSTRTSRVLLKNDYAMLQYLIMWVFSLRIGISHKKYHLAYNLSIHRGRVTHISVSKLGHQCFKLGLVDRLFGTEPLSKRMFAGRLGTSLSLIESNVTISIPENEMNRQSWVCSLILDMERILNTDSRLPTLIQKQHSWSICK